MSAVRKNLILIDVPVVLSLILIMFLMTKLTNPFLNLESGSAKKANKCKNAMSKYQ